MPGFGNPSGKGSTRKDPRPSGSEQGVSRDPRFAPVKHRTSTHIIKDDRINTGFVRGRHAGYAFSAKVFDEPSEYGIKAGRVSKLEVRDQAGRVVYNYDRGVDSGVETDNAERVTVRNIVRNLDRLKPVRDSSDLAYDEAEAHAADQVRRTRPQESRQTHKTKGAAEDELNDLLDEDPEGNYEVEPVYGSGDRPKGYYVTGP